jgi:hypothetical protein
MDKCYMCDGDGITREHVPPLSFFPKGHRHNLFTVSSCSEHNHGNSLDVEYVRNVVVSQLSTNALARTWFQGPTLRSYKRSPGLINQTFAKITPVIVDGRETVIVECDMPRFELIMEAIAYACYFKDFGKRFTEEWVIFSSNMVATELLLQGLPDPNESLRVWLQSLPFTDMPTSNPEVFKYGIHLENEPEGIYSYRFEFYEGFVVHAIRKPMSSDYKTA